MKGPCWALALAGRYAPEGVSPALQVLGNVGAESCASVIDAAWRTIAIADSALLSENVNLLAVATAGKP